MLKRTSTSTKEYDFNPEVAEFGSKFVLSIFQK